MPDDDLRIRARGLGKAYSLSIRPLDRLRDRAPQWALRDVDLEVRHGETVGVIGRNGAGKSTLLHLICGTIKPTAGQVQTAGRVAGLLELGAGFNPEFTGRENIALSAQALGLTADEAKARLPAIEAFAGLGAFIDEPVKRYSSGMFARLAFAVATHVNADVVIVDEILAVGDADFSQKCMRWLYDFRKHGTLLFASHDLPLVAKLCDRVIWIDNGTIRASGPPQDVCTAYRADVLRRTKAEAIVYHPAALREDKAVRIPTRLEDAQDISSASPITSLRLLDTSNEEVRLLEGGETIVVSLQMANAEAMTVGFVLEDAKARALASHMSACAAENGAVRLSWTLPHLAAGEYSVRAFTATLRDQDVTAVAWHAQAAHFHVSPRYVSHGHLPIPVNVSVQPLVPRKEEAASWS